MSQSPQFDNQQTELSNPTLLKSDNSAKYFFTVYLRGIVMGAADIVPGVSGGTIALIVGVYERLLLAIASVRPQLWQIFWQNKQQVGFAHGIKAVWKAVDGTFLLSLLAGIATSFIVLAGGIKYLLEHEPLLIGSFFFGLVVSAVFLLLPEIKSWSMQRIILFILGVLLSVGLSVMPVLNSIGTPSLPFLFFSGALTICAMILPGISGSFILLLLGVYGTALEALHSFNLSILLTLALGAVTGLLCFARFLKWLLIHYYQATLAFLVGVIVGSLVKIYPWRVLGQAVLPWEYPTGANWLATLSLMVLGAVMVLGLSWLGKRH